MIELEEKLGVHVASFSATTCVYKVMGAPKVLGDYYPDLARRALRDDRLLRPQPLLDQHLALVQAGPAVLGPRPQRRDQHDRAAAPGGADARRADPARLLGLPGPEPHDRHPGPAATALSLAEAMEMVVPPIVDEIRCAARGAARLLHVPAPDDGPVRAGPGGADRPPRRRVRVLRRRARPAPALAGRDRTTTSSSAPSPASSRSTRWSPSRSRWPRARSALVTIDRERKRSTPARARRDAADRPRALAGAQRRRGRSRRYDRALETGGPLEGAEIPGYTDAGPEEPVKVADRVLAGFGWQRDDVKLVQQMASNGAEPIGSLGYDGPLAALSPERQNLADYFKETVAVVTNPAIDREREIEHFSTRAVFGRRPVARRRRRRHRHGRDRASR